MSYCRTLEIGFVAFALSMSCLLADGLAAQSMTPLEVAYAGSMGPMMNGAVRPAIAKSLGAELHGRAQGSSGLANLIVARSIRPDVFISVTPGPMRSVLRGGQAAKAIPIARTEMVIAYSPISSFAADFAKADTPGGKAWWRILQSSGVRFGRTDPNTDPQGLNIIFTMRLAAPYYRQPDLAEKILGAQVNPQQIFQEPDVMARLQAGQLDASSAYRTQPQSFGLPFISLPTEINLGDAAMEDRYAKASVTLNGKTVHPAPLIFYVAALRDGAHRDLADKFVSWWQTPAAREILARYHYDGPGDAQPLTP